MANLKKRILHELDDLLADTSSGVQIHLPDQSNMMHLQGQFTGPPETPYAGGTFIIDINIPEGYPFFPPKMNFRTRIWHPNISSQTGAICLDTLSRKWSPVLTIKTALLSVQSLLNEPVPNDPQDAEVAQQLLSNPELFRRTARAWAVQYAGAPEDADDGAGGQGAAAGAVDLGGEEERRRMLKGYSPGLVGRFENMGFATEDVVAALEAVGVSKFKEISDAEADDVVEQLLG